MDAATLTAIVAVPATVVSVGSALWATVKQRRTEDASVTIQAFNLLLETYQTDNKDLRDRVRSLDAQVGDLRVQVALCESDKSTMKVQYEAQIKTQAAQIETLQAKLDSIQRQIDDTTTG